VHELSHSANVGAGHRGKFVLCIRKLWLEGVPTKTVIGDEFRKNFGSLIDCLGEYPHGKLNVQANRKVQSTRMLKASCPNCGYTIRLSSKWADQGLPVCPLDGEQLVL
jgi:hypothetical protein